MQTIIENELEKQAGMLTTNSITYSNNDIKGLERKLTAKEGGRSPRKTVVV